MQPDPDDPLEFRTRRGQQRKLDDEDVQLALQMYMDDKPIEEIMAFFGVSRSTLYTYLRPHLLRPDF